MNIQGTIHAIFDTQVVSEKFQKRNFVVEFAENPLYPQLVSFQFIQDKVGLLDAFSVGASVDVSFNIKGRSWTSPQGETKYFNTLEAWRITPAQSVASADPQVVTQKVGKAPAPPVASIDGDDDLPF